MSPRILIMAGGTGGHIFPALAVAEELCRHGAEVSWLGSRHGLEAELVPRAGYEIDYISIGGLRGKGAWTWLAAPLRLLRALWQALGVVRRRRPAAVLGLGGFVTGPGGLAAWLLRCPLLIHEQNARPGLTNRLLARIARRVLVAFPGTFPDGRGELVGNPVRRPIAALPAPAARYAGRSGPLRLLVVGGSQGAMALNETVPAALARLAPEIRPLVCHQSGGRNREAVEGFYRAAGLEFRVSSSGFEVPASAAAGQAGNITHEARNLKPETITLLPFIEEMAEAYAWADLVLCRAGALTVSELAAAGVAAVLVPFPYAVDDHQTLNARYLADAGAARLLPQSEMNTESLARLLGEYCREPQAGRQRLQQMAEAARALARPTATDAVAEACLQAAGGDA